MSFFERSDTDQPESLFTDLYNEDFVLAACCVGRRQFTRLDTSPYQRELLERGLNCWAQGEYPDRRMEQGMGYTSSVGMMLMDELAGMCKRNEERFTGIRTDLGKLEMEVGMVCDWSSRVQDQVTVLETNMRWLEASRRAMRKEMADMLRGMYLLVELNWQLMESVCQLRASHVHSWGNPIVINEPEDDVLDLALVQVPAPVQH